MEKACKRTTAEEEVPEKKLKQNQDNKVMEATAEDLKESDKQKLFDDLMKKGSNAWKNFDYKNAFICFRDAIQIRLVR